MYTGSPANNRMIDIVQTMPKPAELPNGTIYGNYSVILPSKRKQIPFHHAVVIDDIVGTQTSFTRLFMKSLGRRIIRREELNTYLTARPPMTVIPSLMKDAVYIDIVSAYPSIYKYLGWKSDYCRGKYWGVNDRLTYPFSMGWKAGRSFIVTGARHLQFGRYVKNGTIESKPFISPYSNPPLVAGVYDVLSAIGRFAVYAMHAKYWNIDGGILPSKGVEMFTAFIESLGLQARVKHWGDAVILTGGYWKVGKHETLNYKGNKNSRIIGGDYNSIKKEEAEWILKKFQTITEMKG